MVLPKFELMVLSIIMSAGYAFVFPVPFPVMERLSIRPPAVIMRQPQQLRLTKMVSKATTDMNGAKERLLDNLERRRAGEDVPKSDLDDDLALLSSARTTSQQYSTNTGNPATWGGVWQICYAPHIEILGKLLLTEFGSVEYNFVGGDGRMVSNASYDSKVFGSGWFNADGKVVAMEGDGVRNQDHDLVKVVFERFWWDRRGERRPSQAPAGAAAEGVADRAVDWFVQTAGDALFLDGISVFPVRYLDNDLCVFEFKASGTLVVSQRVG